MVAPLAGGISAGLIVFTPSTDAWTAAVLVDELDTGQLQCASDGQTVRGSQCNSSSNSIVPPLKAARHAVERAGKQSGRGPHNRGGLSTGLIPAEPEVRGAWIADRPAALFFGQLKQRTAVSIIYGWFVDLRLLAWRAAP